MNKSRFWVIVALLAIVGTLAGGWFIGIAPQLAVATAAKNDRASVMAANQKNQIALARLRRDYLHIDALKNQTLSLQKSVPPMADIPSFVTELNTLANARKVTLKSIVVSDAKPYTPISQSSTGKNSPNGSSQINPKITPANFVTIPVQIAVSGDYGKVLDFVNDVQLGQRLFLVSALSSIGATNSKGAKGNPTTSGGAQRVDSSITGYIYVLLS
jgi:Tfp pilus assembly protein PilO